MLKIAVVAAGGAIGALLRFGVGNLLQRWVGPHVPLGTLCVNVVGCFAIGFVAALIMSRAPVREEIPAFLLVGLLGAFTTFSTYGWETFQLARNGAFGQAALYVLASNVFGLLGVWAGFVGARLWLLQSPT